MREGRVFKRCGKCGASARSDTRRCGRCRHDRFSWAFQVDIAARGAARRQRKRQGFVTKAAALAAMHEVQTAAANGTLVEPSKQTVSQFLRSWLQTVRPPALRPGTWETYRIHTECYIIPALGEVRLQALTRQAIKAFYADLAISGRRRRTGGLGAKSIHNVHVTLRRALATALEDGAIARNPATGAHTLPSDTTAERETWTEDDLRRFLVSVRSDRLYALWRLAATTGMRRGELLALSWAHFDLGSRIVRVERNRVLGEGRRVIEGPPKTSRGRRSIDIDDETAAVIRGHRRRQLEERLAWGETWRDTGHVFTRQDGEPLHPEWASDRFETLVKAAGTPVLGMHAALRHLHGSVLLRTGVPLHVVSRRLGHANAAFTANVYAHVLPGQQAEAAAEFASVIDN